MLELMLLATWFSCYLKFKRKSSKDLQAMQVDDSTPIPVWNQPYFFTESQIKSSVAKACFLYMESMLVNVVLNDTISKASCPFNGLCVRFGEEIKFRKLSCLKPLFNVIINANSRYCLRLQYALNKISSSWMTTFLHMFSRWSSYFVGNLPVLAWNSEGLWKLKQNITK